MALHPQEFKADLEREATIFTRYLLDRDPPHEMVNRYISANQILLQGPPPSSDETVLQFVRKNPWAVPLLDAATGLLNSDSLIRKKIYIMSAILEASPHYVSDFLPKSSNPLILVVRLAFLGFTSILKTVFGIPLLVMLRRRPN